MRFYFDIDDDEFSDEFGIDFQSTVKDRVCDLIADNVWDNIANPDSWYSEVNSHVYELLKSKQNAIIEAVIERVSEKIAKKKEIVAITPKASELAAADKENIAYFEQMVDKAIARRFGKC